MYNFLTLLTGAIIAVMVALNGNLSDLTGLYISTVIIHIVGILFAFFMIKITKKQVKWRSIPHFSLYLGGFFGFFTTVFTNFAYGKITMTSIVALSLFGQTASSLLIDSLGLFHMQKQPFNKSSLVGIGCSLLGILVMLDSSVQSALLAVLLAFGSGISIILSRVYNSNLSKYVGELQGSFINHIAGLPVAILFALIFQQGTFPKPETFITPEFWMYLGGVLGVAVVLLYNLVVPKISAFKVTVLSFLGQLFAGIALDLFTGAAFSSRSLLGGVIITIGISLNFLLEIYAAKKHT